MTLKRILIVMAMFLNMLVIFKAARYWAQIAYARYKGEDMNTYMLRNAITSTIVGSINLFVLSSLIRMYW
jgi:hypothetical protein